MNNFKYAPSLVFLSTSMFHIQHGKNNCLPKIKLNWCFKYWSIFVLKISSLIFAVTSVYFFSALKFSENKIKKKIASTERWLRLKQCTKIEWKTLSNHINKNIYIFNWIFTYFRASLTQIHRMTLRAKKNSHFFQQQITKQSFGRSSENSLGFICHGWFLNCCTMYNYYHSFKCKMILILLLCAPSTIFGSVFLG